MEKRHRLQSSRALLGMMRTLGYSLCIIIAEKKKKRCTCTLRDWSLPTQLDAFYCAYTSPFQKRDLGVT